MTDPNDWQGRIGATWADEWKRTDRSFAELSAVLEARLRTAAAGVTGRAVDIGCGAGTTTIALAAARSDIEVIGLDVSSELVAVAAERSRSIANLRFLSGDALAVIPTLAPVDLLVSRHGVMFFADPQAAFATLRAACTPGVPLIFSCFRGVSENPWAASFQPPGAAPPVGYVPGPFAFADPERVRGWLTAAGWRDVVSEPIDYAYVAGAGDDPVGDAVDFFQRIGPAAARLRDAAPTDRPELLAAMRATIERYRTASQVAFPAAAWLWTARAP